MMVETVEMEVQEGAVVEGDLLMIQVLHLPVMVEMDLPEEAAEV